MKLQPQQKVTVDEQEYVVQLYSPTFGLTLYAKLLRLLGQPLVKLIGMVKGGEKLDILNLDTKDINFDAAGESLQMLFAQLGDDELAPLLKDVLSQTYFSPSLEQVGAQFETAFAGRYMHLFKLTAKTLGVQYADFLSGIVKRKNAERIAPILAPTGEKPNMMRG